MHSRNMRLKRMQMQVTTWQWCHETERDAFASAISYCRPPFPQNSDTHHNFACISELTAGVQLVNVHRLYKLL